ncbi:enoyl-CoA hydratase/carnithine racemase [Streptomyces sp. Amel2xB2]|uniref:enoyl-CoA hydratase-related protein n=1 Tax=Streptomyces sp. Amel2xB2 TaxID=1305829 RepID=UPI000DB9B44F|nr:enoyl-CoA hydratase-related protein [Streptomyces sp. Amel2xB2]RAJ60557.1 enoyl-CoA hydratase/carnithine racemase [Streptomyces sp. Amel2xB2]
MSVEETAAPEPQGPPEGADGPERPEPSPSPSPSVTWREEEVPGTGGSVARITLANPRLHNALTLEMYDQLHQVCEEIDAAPRVRVAVLRGAGGRALAAGTDIREFRGFTGADGVAYERRVGRAVTRLAALRMPVVAAVEGPAVGGGLALTACCDIVVCTPDAVFGAPIARTLGNCLAPAVVARLHASLGRARTQRALLTAELITAREAYEAGFVTEIVDRDGGDEEDGSGGTDNGGGSGGSSADDGTDAEPAPDGLGAYVDRLIARVAGGAPLTLAALKEADRRVLAASEPAAADDLYELCYGSRDFGEGVAAFLGKRAPEWEGR